MRRRKRPFLFFILSLLCFGTLSYIVFYYSPSGTISLPNLPISFSSSLVFFLLLLGALSGLFIFIFHNTRRGILFGLCITAIFLLRFFGLKNLLFVILVICLSITIELFFRQQE